MSADSTSTTGTTTTFFIHKGNNSSWSGNKQHEYYIENERNKTVFVIHKVGSWFDTELRLYDTISRQTVATIQYVKTKNYLLFGSYSVSFDIRCSNGNGCYSLEPLQTSYWNWSSNDYKLKDNSKKKKRNPIRIRNLTKCFSQYEYTFVDDTTASSSSHIANLEEIRGCCQSDFYALRIAEETIHPVALLATSIVMCQLIRQCRQRDYEFWTCRLCTSSDVQ